MAAIPPLSQAAKMLRIFISQDDRCEGRVLHECIVERLRASGFAGATVHRGMLGYGADRRLRPTGFLGLSHDEPVVITVVDVEEKVRAFLPILDTMVTEGLVTVSDVDSTFYRRRP
jgi:hypothetical protein